MLNKRCAFRFDGMFVEMQRTKPFRTYCNVHHFSFYFVGFLKI